MWLGLCGGDRSLRHVVGVAPRLVSLHGRVISICDFAMRPAIPSIVRSVYPDYCRSHSAGTMRQYASIVFLVATLGSAAVLSAASSAGIYRMIQIEITVAGLACAAAFASFRQIPDHGDGSAEEAAAEDAPTAVRSAAFAPFRDKWFRRYFGRILRLRLRESISARRCSSILRARRRARVCSGHAADSRDPKHRRVPQRGLL